MGEPIYVHPLSKPIQAHGEEIRELRFRDPTGRDIRLCGNPVEVALGGDSPDIGFDEKKMTAMMSALAEVPPSTIDALPASEWTAIAWALTPFFLPSQPGTSSKELTH